MTGHSRGRSTRRWRVLRAQVLAEETHCIRCGLVVDVSLPPRTPQSPSVDHIVPIVEGGARESRANLGLAHYGCNSRAGARLRHERDRPASPAGGPRVFISLDPRSL